jgi:uroporphyrinogen-III synthase
VKLFLSRDTASEALTVFAQESGYELVTFSCIQKEVITRTPPPEADWIFFYSPSAVELFLMKFADYRAKHAALGEGTARIFRESGAEPYFVGASPQPSEVMKEFVAFISNDEQVVQARGETSFERLREVLPAERIIDWPFYRSIAKTDLDELNADIYIFTSPSNAEAYLNLHAIDHNATVIVFGQSTKKAVEKYTTARVLITDQPGEESVLDTIKGLSASN